MINRKSSILDKQDKVIERPNLFLELDTKELSRLSCSICNHVMQDPTQVSCGCRFCLGCIEGIMIEDKTMCPNCTEENIERHTLIRDKAVEKEILNLNIRCSNDGCTHTMTLKQLTKHLQVCDYRREQCGKCEQWYRHTKRHDHVTEECSQTMIVCIDCSNEMTREYSMNMHKNYDDNAENICDKWTTKCPYKCDEVTLVNVKMHLETCANKPIQCPIRSIGCDVTGPRDIIDRHVTEDGTNHQILMMKEIEKLKKEGNELREGFRIKEEEMEIEREELERMNSVNVMEVETLTIKMAEMKRNIDSLVTEVEAYKRGSSTDSGQPGRDIVSINGSTIWTITDIRQRIRDAKSKSVDSNIVSDNFYVTRPGYNMTLKIYPNGDGRAKDTCVSVYFVISKGDYDSEISWPFRSKITLSLLSNSHNKQDITVHMKPDNNAACYGRPMRSHNVGAGQPDFVRQWEIMDNDYFLHNGALKVKIRVTTP